MNKKNITKNKFTKKIENDFINLIENGKNFEQASKKLGISRMTEYRYRKDNPEYAEKIEDAKRVRVETVEQSLFEKAINGNVTASIFILKCWDRDRYIPENSVPEDQKKLSWADFVMRLHKKEEEKKKNG